MTGPLRPVRVIATGRWADRVLDEVRRAGGEVLGAYESGGTVVALVRSGERTAR